MKKIVFLLVLSISALSFGQKTGAIHGKIVDSEMFNEPLLMASVSIKGTSFSTRTNFKGNFEIPNIPEGSYTVQIQFVGYERVELPILIKNEETAFIHKSLKAKTLELDLAAVETPSK